MEHCLIPSLAGVVAIGTIQGITSAILPLLGDGIYPKGEQAVIGSSLLIAGFGFKYTLDYLNRKWSCSMVE